MRVTNSMTIRSTLRDLSQGLARMQETNQRITSGRQNLRPSDDPTMTSVAMTVRGELRRNEQMTREFDDAKNWIDAADTALIGTLDGLRTANDLAIQAGNSGTLQPQARAAIAQQIRAIRSELLASANSKVAGRSLFNGTAAGDAYDANGQYLGDNGSVTRDLAPSLTVTVNSTGPTIFGTNGGSPGTVFDVLDRMATAVSMGNSADLAAEQTNLGTATDRVNSALADIGVRGARLDSIKERHEDDRLRLTTQLSAVEDVDIVDALIKSKEQEASYQASLQVAAKIIPPSLMDFLR
jgi:flagellar hook-associated protein 3 FlgL